MHLLPRAFHQANLVFLFLVEVPLPFCVFLTGWPRIVAAAGVTALMLGIHVSGLVYYLCVPGWDSSGAS
jgi:hypothetical protein